MNRDPSDPAPPSTLHVMLVEDNALLVRELTSALEASGRIEVTAVARSEAAARDTLFDNPARIDLVVLDVFLSEGSGIGIIEDVRLLDMGIRTVVLTNFASLAVRRRCIACGVDRVFDKSTQLDEFLDYVQRLTARRDEHGELHDEADTLSSPPSTP